LKSFITIALSALALIGLGLFMTNRDDNSSHSNSPEALALCEEGTRDVNAFRLRAGVEKLAQCLALDPSLVEASIARAIAFSRLGERDNLQMELARADSLVNFITDDNRRMLAQLRLGTFGKKHFSDISDSILTRLENETPNNIHVLVARASNLGQTDDDDAYEQAWLNILEVDPNYANSYNMLGYMELNRGNYDQSIDYMQKYAFLAPNLANPHDSLGEVLMVLGRYEEAEAEFRTSVTMQPDFYYSLINLGKTYLARGQLERGLDILEKVRSQVSGSDLEKRVDHEIVSTFLVAGLDQELARMSAIFVDRYPEDSMSCLLRGIRLTYQGQYEMGKAVMDSSLLAWREDESYQYHEKAKKNIDSAGYQFEALTADIMGDYETGAKKWQLALDQDTGKAHHELWYLHYRLATDLFAMGKTAETLAIIDPMLNINPRLIHVLVLKVKCHLEENDGAAAQTVLEQLQWSISKSDAGFPARLETARLEALVLAMAGAQ